MENLRWGKRFYAQLKAQFGIENFSQTGSIDDLSVFGFFLRSRKYYPPDTLLKIRIFTREGQSIVLVGMVQWIKKRPVNAIGVTQGAGMGIQIQNFLNGQNIYESICKQLCGIPVKRRIAI